MRHILFFALKEDILPVLEAAERVGPLKYVRMGNFLTPDFKEVSHGAEIPDLGKATMETASGSESYLVTEHEVAVHVRHITTPAGVKRYLLDQLFNPDTVTFTPAGIWNDDVVLHGRVATVSDSPIAQELMKRFSKAIRKHFTKVNAFWVGREALALLKAGKRLTISAKSPRDFDLTTAL